MSPRLRKVVGRESPRVTSTAEPDGGNLLVRIWRGAGVGNLPAYSTTAFSTARCSRRPRLARTAGLRQDGSGDGRLRRRAPGGTDSSLQQQTRCPDTKALATLEAQRRGAAETGAHAGHACGRGARREGERGSTMGTAGCAGGARRTQDRLPAPLPGSARRDLRLRTR